MAGDALTIRSFREDDRTALVALWQRCELTRPWNDPDRDIDRKVAVDDGLLLVAHLDAASPLVGTVMIGYWCPASQVMRRNRRPDSRLAASSSSLKPNWSVVLRPCQPEI